MAPRSKETLTADAVGVLDATVVETPSTALVPAAPQAVAPVRPFSSGKGKEEIDEDDIYLARLTLAQLTSPQLLDGKPEYIDGLKAGHFFNGVTQEIYGKGPLRFVIVKMTKRAGVFDEAGKLVERDVKWNDPRCEWPKDADGNAILDEKGQKVQPAASQIYDFLVVLLVNNKPYAGLGMSLKKTSKKAGKQLASMLHASPGEAWDFVYEVSSIAASSNGYNYYVPKVVRKEASSEEVRAFANAFYEAGVKVRDDEATADAGVPSDDVPF